jgi:L-ascorbate metabolism protein UlaG (beta-lactamase superfamily)
MLTVAQDGAQLIIDPGSFSATLPELSGTVGVVVTHEHADHWTPAHLRSILAAAGDIPVFGPQGVADAAAGFDVTVAAPGETHTVGPFTLRFFGGRHEVIHSSIPVVDNVGVLVDEKLYYPGDSYAVPALPSGVRVPLLAAPVGAPWLKIGEAMDFVLATAPEVVFGTHDRTLSAAGLDMGRARLGWSAAQHGGRLHTLEDGESIEV